MRAVFEEDQERAYNKLNKNSVKFRMRDFGEYDRMQTLVFFDDNDKRMSDAEIYLPQDKAYIVLNRIHFGEPGKVFEGSEKEALKRMTSYLFYPSNLKYLASAIYIHLPESGISEDMANELGFCPFGDIAVRLLNRNFEQFLEHAPDDADVKNEVLQAYSALRDKDKAYLDVIRKQLTGAKESLQIFEEQGNQVMVEAKKEEIRHYEAILGIGQRDRER